jgi:hypothetical protein
VVRHVITQIESRRFDVIEPLEGVVIPRQWYTYRRILIGVGSGWDKQLATDKMCQDRR